jgi:hypothetical protein
VLSLLWRKLLRPWALPILRAVWTRVPARLKPWLTPAQPADVRPSAGSFEGRYIRSFLFLRLIIGVIGLLLPFVLVGVDATLFHGAPWPRGSESVYYYSGMREVFTVSLGTVAFFLLTYKITERNLDNTLSMFAGFFGLLIPFFPTHEPSAVAKQFPPTDLQKLFHNHGWTAYVHYTATSLFIVGLGGVIILFGQREGERVARHTILTPTSWRRYHYWCARLIGLAAVWIVVTNWLWQGSPRISLLLGEGLATAAFGASWLAKGAEIKYLLHGQDKTPL